MCTKGDSTSSFRSARKTIPLTLWRSRCRTAGKQPLVKRASNSPVQGDSGEDDMKQAKLAVALTVAVLVASSAPYAQTVSTTTGAINGTVTDTTKAVLPGVTVTLSGPA